jgi:hypothetical protein
VTGVQTCALPIFTEHFTFISIKRTRPAGIVTVSGTNKSNPESFFEFEFELLILSKYRFWLADTTCKLREYVLDIR